MESKITILLADDDKDIREIGKILLEGENYEVIEAADGQQVIEAASDRIDLYILDVMMPKLNGYQVCRELRKTTSAPILFLTARTQVEDKSMGFSAGGDDYLAKPFSYTELLARVKALLRRYYVYKGKETPEQDVMISAGDITIDPKRMEAKRAGELLPLTDIEFNILLTLAKHKGQVLSAKELYEEVWNETYFYSCNNTLMVHIRNLRKKVETTNDTLIRTVWGKGYRID
ncbi:MAG: response regulator transcription factor [Clostridiales bacterium]|nr:response regulator transcription factor [Clostridiales bacterium]